MQVQAHAMVKKVAGLFRWTTARKRKDATVVVPDEKTFGAIFAGNAETARKNLDRFAPRT